MEAALKGATQIGFTIISLTVSLIAVLIPLLFMGDVVGRLFREFAVTLAITILISAVVSLTLVPMMSARWLKQPRRDETAGRGAARACSAASTRVIASLRPRPALGARRTSALTLLVALGTLVLTVLLYLVIPEGPVPDAGHRPAAGARRGRAGRLVRAHGASCSRRPRARSCRTRTSRPSAPSSASTPPTTPCCTPAAC